LPSTMRTFLIIALVLISTLSVPCVAAQGDQWREVDPVKVLIDSNADWGRIMFDDLNGTNSNGIRIKSVLGTGWLTGKDENDVLDAGRKIPWPDTEYNRIITRKGDMVSFFKGIRNFNYTELYADLILEVEPNLPQIYVWLMTGGNGTTTFDILSKTTGGTIWRDVVVGTGETQQVRRIMTPQPFFRTGRAESAVVVAWLSVGLVIMIVLNFPLLEVLSHRIRTRNVAKSHRRKESEAVEKE
jgi:hypothetical protein